MSHSPPPLRPAALPRCRSLLKLYILRAFRAGRGGQAPPISVEDSQDAEAGMHASLGDQRRIDLPEAI
eukprot:4044334-Pyramimonas_sp.AAC.1